MLFRSPQGISINTFCLIHGVLYRYFNSWFVKTRKKIVPVQIEVIPSSDSALEAFLASVCVESALMQSNLEINSGNILVTIQTRNGLNIRKGNLDYRGLKILVEKLEAYVDDFRFEEFLLSS